MNKNYMEELAAMFGLTLREEFQIHGLPDNVGDNEYFFDTEGLYHLTKEGLALRVHDTTVVDLITGELKITKKPRKPRMNEVYYFIDNIGEISDCLWECDEIDNLRYKLGNCRLDDSFTDEEISNWSKFMDSDRIIDMTKR